MSENHRLEDYLLPGLPAERVRACYTRAAGHELTNGKFFSPESSAGLVANCFGLFLDRPEALPPLPGTAALGWPASYVDLEAVVRFPWSGGRHPHLDVLIETDEALIGIESKRYEPFRAKSSAEISDAYLRPVWGEKMVGYERMRGALCDGTARYRHLDAAQLVKHALGLRTAIHRQDRACPKQPVLFYLFAEPATWSDGQPLRHEHRTAHRNEIQHFADAVAGDEVTFLFCSYARLLAAWSAQTEAPIRAHAAAVRNRYVVD